MPDSKPQREPLVIALEQAERGLADAERIIEARTGKGSWVGSLVLASVREVLQAETDKAYELVEVEPYFHDDGTPGVRERRV